MHSAMRWVGIAAVVCGSAAEAQERLAVFEFLARQSTYCIAGAPAVITLQGEMQGRAVLLEYDFDAGSTAGRYQCYRAADPYGGYLPLVMTGSGFRTSSGPVNYEPIYRGMIEQELARAPEAAVAAYSRRQGDALRVYVEAENRSGAALTPESRAAIWVIAWENARIRLTDTWVRAAVRSPIGVSVAAGERITAVVETPALTGVSWERIESLAMVERRTAAGGRYDMLQAAVSRPAALLVSPGQVTMPRSAASAEIELAGPHALAWTAEPDSPWLEVVPASGTVPTTATVRAVVAALPAGTVTGHVRIDAIGDGMVFTASVTVTVEGRQGTIRRRLRQAGCAPAPMH